ncbi:MAG: GIY-YIG nuclease family protein [Nitrospira sp.]|nr:GIY-YIG nuclease family protein [Nitrospira sp.]
MRAWYCEWQRLQAEGHALAHNAGRGSAYTSKRRPVRLMYMEHFKTEAEAVKQERQLKRWNAEKKRSLISGDIQTLKRLSKRYWA